VVGPRVGCKRTNALASVMVVVVVAKIILRVKEGGEESKLDWIAGALRYSRKFGWKVKKDGWIVEMDCRMDLLSG